MLSFFDNTIANIATALQFAMLGREKAGVDVCAANDHHDHLNKIGIGKCFQERETARDQFMSSGLEKDGVLV